MWFTASLPLDCLSQEMFCRRKSLLAKIMIEKQIGDTRWFKADSSPRTNNEDPRGEICL